jgi:hypothetical protein
MKSGIGRIMEELYLFFYHCNGKTIKEIKYTTKLSYLREFL